MVMTLKEKKISLADALNLPDEQLIVCGSKQTVLDKKHFLIQFAKTGNISATCDALGISRWAIYERWFETDEEFKALFKKAELQYLDKLTAECDRRALDKSDILLMFRMKKLDPSYRETGANINVSIQEVKRIEVRLSLPELPGPTNQTGQIIEGQIRELEAPDNE